MAAVQTALQPAFGEQRAIGQKNATCSGFATPPEQPTVLYDDVPTIVHASEQKFIKSEDVTFVRSVVPVFGDVHSVFMVCDGHMGVGAAQHCVNNMPGLLNQLLPPHLPDWTTDSEVELYAEKVRRAISTAAVLLDNDWARLNDSAGTTLTMAVLSGWLLTVANTGDSNAILDCGDDVQEITFSHRIQVNKAEQDRLRQAGAQLAPVGFHLQGPAKPQEMGVGPLRMWPGGLCVSRSIGDLDAGPLIVPLPHVRQVIINRNRALRIIMASDGLWDLMSFSKAAKSVRHKLPAAAVDSLVQMAVRDRRMADDVSIIVADVLPPPTPGATPPQFPAAALKAGSPGSSSGASRSSSGGLFRCFKSSPVDDDIITPPDITPPQPSQPSPQTRMSMDIRRNLAGGLARISGALGGGGTRRAPGPPVRPWLGLQWFADVDCYVAYPMHKDQLARTEAVLQRPKTPPKRIGDFTVHGGQAHRFQQDSSWHTGNSHHGTSGELPMLLSQQQLEQLQADGPAAAASMHFSSNANGSAHGLQEQQQQLSPRRQQQQHDAAAGSSGLYSGGSSSLHGRSPAAPASRSHLSLTAAAAAAAAAPASPSPTALARSASAEFEHGGTGGVYVAPEDGGQGLGAPGRMVKPSEAAALHNHYGSAPEAVVRASEGRVHSGRGALAAAVAADDDERTHGFGMGI